MVQDKEENAHESAVFDLRSTLQNAVNKLRDSNRQLQAAIDNGDSDPEYKIAIGENIVVIARHAAKIEELDKELCDYCEAVARSSGVALITDEEQQGRQVHSRGEADGFPGESLSEGRSHLSQAPQQVGPGDSVWL